MRRKPAALPDNGLCGAVVIVKFRPPSHVAFAMVRATPDYQAIQSLRLFGQACIGVVIGVLLALAMPAWTAWPIFQQHPMSR